MCFYIGVVKSKQQFFIEAKVCNCFSRTLDCSPYSVDQMFTVFFIRDKLAFGQYIGSWPADENDTLKFLRLRHGYRPYVV